MIVRKVISLRKNFSVYVFFFVYRFSSSKHPHSYKRPTPDTPSPLSN